MDNLVQKTTHTITVGAKGCDYQTLTTAIAVAAADPTNLYTIHVFGPVDDIYWDAAGNPLNGVTPVYNVHFVWESLPDQVTPMERYQTSCPAYAYKFLIRADDGRRCWFETMATLGGKTPLRYAAYGRIPVTMGLIGGALTPGNAMYTSGQFMTDAATIMEARMCFGTEMCNHSFSHDVDVDPTTTSFLMSEILAGDRAIKALSATHGTMPTSIGVGLRSLIIPGTWTHGMYITTPEKSWSFAARFMRRLYSIVQNATSGTYVTFGASQPHFGFLQYAAATAAGIVAGNPALVGDTSILVHGIADVWAVNTKYAVGSVAIAADDVWYMCKVAHNTHVAWATGAAYAVGDEVYTAGDTKYYKCKVAHTSTTGGAHPSPVSGGNTTDWDESTAHPSPVNGGNTTDWDVRYATSAAANTAAWLSAAGWKAFIDYLITRIADGTIYPVTLSGYYYGDKLSTGVPVVGDEPMIEIDFNDYTSDTPVRALTGMMFGTGATLESFDGGDGSRTVLQIAGNTPAQAYARFDLQLPPDRSYGVVVDVANSSGSCYLKMRAVPSWRTTAGVLESAPIDTCGSRDKFAIRGLAYDTQITANTWALKSAEIGVPDWSKEYVSLILMNDSGAAGNLMVKRIRVYAQ